MSIEGFIDALDAYLAKAAQSADDAERAASRERLIYELGHLLHSQESNLVSAAEDRFTNKIEGIKKNPLNKFLGEVNPLTKIAWSAAAHKQITPLQHEAFIRNEEERNYAMIWLPGWICLATRSIGFANLASSISK